MNRFVCIPNKLFELKLNVYEFAVLCYLFKCRNSMTGECFPSYNTISTAMNISRSTVVRATSYFYEDRDRSGYTFEQREGYQELRRKMINLEYDILIVKDFSRFSRRNSKGLVELEDLRDRGMRIISVGDSIDYPTFDDWTAIQFRFLINEMPVTDTSKKVKSVIKRRQEEANGFVQYHTDTLWY